MSRINPVNIETLDSETAEVLTAVKNNLGMLPNIFTTFAHSPVTLNGYLQLSETLSKGELLGKEREMIAITVAQENQCGYCLSAHAAIGKGEGLSEEEILLSRTANAKLQKDEAIMKFAQEVVRTQGAVSDESLASIREACGSDGVVLEIVSNVVLNVMTNYLNRLAGTEIDFPLVNLDSVA